MPTCLFLITEKAHYMALTTVIFVAVSVKGLPVDTYNDRTNIRRPFGQVRRPW